MSKETGGPAFPQFSDVRDHDGRPLYASGAYDGMTLRDYFAAKVLQGFCANPAVFAANGMSGWDLVNCTEEQLAEVCNRLADAMLAERGKP